MTDKKEELRERNRRNKQAERARKAARGIKELRDVYVKEEHYKEAQRRSRAVINDIESATRHEDS